MATLQTPSEKLVICIHTEVQRAAHQSLYDINKPVAEEGVTVLKQSVCMSQTHAVRKGKV